jgi:hypothetical protein
MPLGNGPVARFVPGFRIARFSGTTRNDPFAGPALNPWWSRLGPSPASAAFSTTGGVTTLGITLPAQRDRLTETAAAAQLSGDYTLRGHFRNLSNGGGMFGLAIVDASGNGVGYSPYNDGNTYMWSVAGWNYSGTGPNNGGQPPLAGDFWLELHKVGTAWTGRYTTDPNGLTGWTSYTGALTWAGTPAELGFMRLYTSGGTIVATLLGWQIV